MNTPQQLLPGVPWYDISDPSSPTLDQLAAKYDIHELQVEDCRHAGQRAKTEEYEHYIFTVLKQLQKDEKLGFSDFSIFLGRDYLITVHAAPSDILDRLLRRARQQNVQRVDKLFYMLVDLVVDDYLALLDDLTEEISQIETEVLEAPEPTVLRRIFRLKRRLIEFRRIAANTRDVVNELIRREQGLLGDDLDPYFRDVYDHVTRTVELIETYRDLLTGSLDIYLSAVANRTNQVMKVLTVWGTVSLPMVIITGFFGMNLHIPWTNNPWGAVYASAIMLVSTALILMYFRRKNWF
jgi:magnesium transporter